MTYVEYLLTCLTEECAEVSQRATKAIRFGLSEKQPGQGLSNAIRLVGELDDLFHIYELLRRTGTIPPLPVDTYGKRDKIFRYMDYSMELGKLDQEVIRASGDALCMNCEEPFRKHPLGGPKGVDDVQFAHRLCDGRLVKL